RRGLRHRPQPAHRAEVEDGCRGREAEGRRDDRRRRAGRDPGGPGEGTGRHGPHQGSGLTAPELVVLGRGRLGQSLARALRARLVPGHDWRSGMPFKAGARIFLAVPDPAIAPLAAELAALPLPEGAAVIHLSGALGLAPLKAVVEAGRDVGSFHPLQSFPVEREPEHFRGALVAVDASSARLLGELTRLARVLGARPRRVPPEERTLYHAAAVLASNYLVALSAQAAGVLGRA